MPSRFTLGEKSGPETGLLLDNFYNPPNPEIKKELENDVY